MSQNVSVQRIPAMTGAKGANGPKIGCVSWCFHSFAGGTNPERAIDTIGEPGFDGIELILLARGDIKEYWTDDKIKQLCEQLEVAHLESVAKKIQY